MVHTVLIVDDSPTIRSVAKIHLMGCGYDFVEADSAERALQVLKLVPVSLVLADIRMAGMSGIDFVRAVRADQRPHVRNAPVVLMTGEKALPLRAEAMAAGANAFLNKPITSGALLAVVQQLLPKDVP